MMRVRPDYLRKVLAKSIVLETNLLDLQREVEALTYNVPKNPAKSIALDLILEVLQEGRLYIQMNEAYQIHMAVKKTEKVPGSLAEVGVFRGGSAKLICQAKGERMLHLFDTFEGLPEVEQIDGCKYFHGQFCASLEDVAEYLAEYPNVRIYKGLFPETSAPIKEERFAFVNLDVDLRKSTHDCLEFFYPRMNRGGIIISHDYVHSAGVMNAFDDFFADKPEPVIEGSGLHGSQALVIKM